MNTHTSHSRSPRPGQTPADSKQPHRVRVEPAAPIPGASPSEPPHLATRDTSHDATVDGKSQRVARGKVRWARRLSKNAWFMIAVAVTVAIAAVAITLSL